MSRTHDRLLATDLDGTVIPPDESAERLAEVDAFASAVQGRNGLALAYVTGRHLEHALDGIRSVGLPEPDFLGCEVGAALYARRDGTYVPDERYRRAMSEALGADGRAAARALAAHPDVELQPPRHQGEHKTSFFAPWPVDGRLLDELRALAGAAGARVGFVVSRDVNTGRALVDALPEGVAKDRAVRYLAEVLGLGLERVVFAGDSGNDEAALLAGFRSVIVGNAPAALVERVRAEAERLGRAERVYLARGRYAAGVLEGCRHFGIL